MNRPTGVTVIAVLHFIATAIMVLLAVASFLGGAFIGSMVGASAHQSGAGAAGAGVGALIGAGIGVAFLIGGTLAGVCGYGLWNMKEWGRMLTIVLTGIGLAFGALGLMFSLFHFNIVALFIGAFRLAISAIIIWYLLQPQVKAAFMQQQLAPAH